MPCIVGSFRRYETLILLFRQKDMCNSHSQAIGEYVVLALFTYCISWGWVLSGALVSLGNWLKSHQNQKWETFPLHKIEFHDQERLNLPQYEKCCWVHINFGRGGARTRKSIPWYKLWYDKVIPWLKNGPSKLVTTSVTVRYIFRVIRSPAHSFNTKKWFEALSIWLSF